MKTKINIDSWERGSAFKHFIAYSNPYFGISCNVDCSKAYRAAKQNGVSFFLYYFYQSLAAANAVPAFRIRVENNEPVIFDVVHGSPTILRDDSGLGFALLQWNDNFADFIRSAEVEISRVKSQKTLDASQDRPDTIYYSILPWIQFTSVTHPLDLPNTEGVPILTFGKIFEENGRKLIPLAVHAHHALMDGYDIHRFLESFRERMDLDPV
jgi:chloramphenicol O-acetyltransferase type A